MEVDLEERLWVAKYRPHSVSECVLPAILKQTALDFVAHRNLPNLLLAGSPGIGKTTLALALCHDLDLEYIFIPASEERNIDMVRNRIRAFASTMSMQGKDKAIILDEADFLNRDSAQPALRGMIAEEFAHVRFFLTCNDSSRIIPALHSRTTALDFRVTKTDRTAMLAEFFLNARKILDAEKVVYDQKVVAALLKKFFPDYRRVLNELQRYSAGGVIDSGLLTVLTNNLDFVSLVKEIKAKNFTAVRSWVAQNATTDTDSAVLFRMFYDQAYSVIDPNDIPQLVLLIADYQVKATQAIDKEINLMAFLTEVMSNLNFL